MTLDAQQSLLRALRRHARKHGARNEEEIAKFLGVSRSCLYGWSAKRVMPESRARRLQAKFGIKLPGRIKFEPPPTFDVAWACYEVLRHTHKTAVLKFMQVEAGAAHPDKGVWSVEAPHGRWIVTITPQELQLFHKGSTVMISAATLTSVKEVERIVTTPRTAQVPVRKRVGLTTLRDRLRNQHG